MLSTGTENELFTLALFLITGGLGLCLFGIWYCKTIRQDSRSNQNCLQKQDKEEVQRRIELIFHGVRPKEKRVKRTWKT
jgi:hypothetical protein